MPLGAQLESERAKLLPAVDNYFGERNARVGHCRKNEVKMRAERDHRPLRAEPTASTTPHRARCAIASKTVERPTADARGDANAQAAFTCVHHTDTER